MQLLRHNAWAYNFALFDRQEPFLISKKGKKWWGKVPKAVGQIARLPRKFPTTLYGKKCIASFLLKRTVYYKHVILRSPLEESKFMQYLNTSKSI